MVKQVKPITIQILRDTFIEGELFEKGSVVELEDEVEGLYLIKIGKAKKYTEKATDKKKADK